MFRARVWRGEGAERPAIAESITRRARPRASMEVELEFGVRSQVCDSKGPEAPERILLRSRNPPIFHAKDRRLGHRLAKGEFDIESVMRGRWQQVAEVAAIPAVPAPSSSLRHASGPIGAAAIVSWSNSRRDRPMVSPNRCPPTRRVAPSCRHTRSPVLP